MQKPLPEITCPKCNLSQIWRGQKECIHNGCKWSNWDIAVQLGQSVGAGNTPIEPSRFDRR